MAVGQMPPLFPLREFLRQLRAQGARSSALASLEKTLGLMVAGVIVSAIWVNKEWVVAGMAGAAGILGLAYLVAYFYFLKADPDLLRRPSGVAHPAAVLLEQLPVAGDLHPASSPHH
jgi:hypothetical protein